MRLQNTEVKQQVAEHTSENNTHVEIEALVDRRHRNTSQWHGLILLVILEGNSAGERPRAALP